MTKTKNIFRHLPDLYQGNLENGLLSKILEILSKQLQTAEVDLFKVMKDHWVDQVGDLDVLTRLGALFDIRQREGEEIKEYRRRLKGTVSAYLMDGVGTRDAILEITAATLNLKPEELIRVAEESGISKEQIIVENPPQLARSEVWAVTNNSEWPVKVTGFEIDDEEYFPATILITGVGENTFNPTLTNLTTGVSIGYRGMVPHDMVLAIRSDLSAMLGGKDVSTQVFPQVGGIFNQSVFDSEEAKFTVKFSDKLALPWGTSFWRYTSENARFTSSSTFLPKYNQTLFASYGAEEKENVNLGVTGETVARVQFKWVESQPAAFVVQLPWEIIEVPEGTQAKLDPRRYVSEEVDRVRAAGVQAAIKYFSNFGGNLVETQTHQTKLHALRSRVRYREGIWEREKTFLRSKKTHAEKQLITDHLSFKGVFNRTRLDSSRFG